MKPRIVLLLSSFPRISETFIVQQFLGLLQAGWDVHILCASFSQADWLQYSELRNNPQLRNRIHQILPTRPRWLAGFLYLPLLLLTTLIRPALTYRYFSQGWILLRWDIFRNFYFDQPLIFLKPKLVHVEFGSLAVGKEHIGKCVNGKLIISFRGYDLNFSGLDKKNYYEKVWEQADGLHLLGEDLWLRAKRRGCPGDKLHTLIPPAVDPDVFFPSLDQTHPISQPLRILSVGRLEWKKGYEFGLQAVQIAVRAGVPLEYHIVGGGQSLEALAFARHQLGLDGIVYFMGPLPQNEVIKQYGWANVFLHSAVSEGFCNAVLEAQAMSIPVIATNADGLSENVSDQESGFIVPRRDFKKMAEKIFCLANDPEMRMRMGQAGRARVNQLFQQQKQIQLFCDFYNKVLESE